jgi:hypothetical protein
MSVIQAMSSACRELVAAAPNGDSRMAHVASCPQCNHDLFVPDDADDESWAKCPECRAFFQLNRAAVRELPALLLVESHAVTAAVSPSGDVPSSPSSATDQPPDAMGPPSIMEADSAPPPPQVNAGLQSTAERIDKWFRSAATVPDAPPGFADQPMTDLGLAAAIEGEETSASSTEPVAAPWDDSQHMDQLLADIQAPASQPASDRPPAAHQRCDVSETMAAAPASEMPMFAKATRAKPTRKRSLARAVVFSAAAGVVGSAIGYYALLWLRGASGDFLDVAQYLPAAVLPTDLQTNPQTVPPAAATPDQNAHAKNVEVAQDSPTGQSDDSPEVQATYTTTGEPAAVKPQLEDDRYGIETSQPAEEPAPLQQPAAAPLAGEPATAALRVASAPSFTADELAAALQAAKTARPALMAGKLADGRDVQRAKGYSYSLLADLAQKMSFVDSAAGSESIDASLRAAEDLFRETLADDRTRSEVAVIVPKWIASRHRQHGGLFFAATLTGVQKAGDVAECGAALETGEAFPLLMPASLADSVADLSRPVGIVGWLVDQPRKQIAGYAGQAEQAVWVGKIIALE